jgi:hypothetical protein
MASWSDIQSDVAGYMARDDLTEPIIKSIARFEDHINRVLLTRPQGARTDLTPVAGVATLPPDYLSMRSVTWTGASPGGLDFVTPDYFRRVYTTANSDAPSIYTIEGELLYIDSTSEEPLALSYNQKVPNLNESVSTNWLSQAHADLYIFGALFEINAYTQDMEAAIAWKSRRDEIVRELFLLTFRGPGQMVIQPTGATP